MPAARVIWDAGQCLSADHGDRYFSPDAAGEVSRVFMAPVDLIGRLQAIPKPPIPFLPAQNWASARD